MTTSLESRGIRPQTAFTPEQLTAMNARRAAFEATMQQANWRHVTPSQFNPDILFRVGSMAKLIIDPADFNHSCRR